MYEEPSGPSPLICALKCAPFCGYLPFPHGFFHQGGTLPNLVGVNEFWTQDIWGLFVLIDADHNGVVDIDEFINGAWKKTIKKAMTESERKVSL